MAKSDGVSHDPVDGGPIKNRSCTDILCTLLFLAFIGGWVAVGAWGFKYGNPLVLIYPSDSEGDICGRGIYYDKPYLLFFDLTKCFSVAAVAGCPTKEICISKCPEDSYTVFGLDTDETYKKRRISQFCMPELNETEISSSSVTAKELVRLQRCPAWYLKSGSVLGRCLPFIPNNVTNDAVIFENVDGTGATNLTFGNLKTGLENLSKFLDLRNIGEKIINDLADSWWIIVLGLFMACVISLFWIFLMRFMAGFMIWTSLILSVALLVLSCVFCGFKYTQYKDAGNKFTVTTNMSSYFQLATTWMVLLIGSAIVLLVIFILLIFFRTRIRIAIELIEEAAIAVSGMMSTLFFPIIPFAMELIVVGWFLVCAIYLASTGEKEYQISMDKSCGNCTYKNITYVPNQACDYNVVQKFDCDTCPAHPSVQCMFHKFGPTDTANYLQLYNLFGLLWGMFFLSALDEMVLAGTFASWYWTMDKSKTPRFPLIGSFYRTLRYHIGTLAFGSLIVAIIRMIRLILEYVENKMKEYHQENPIAKAVLCCCRCCFWCLEKFMKFINRNAYIMTAIYGKNFCWSAKEAFSLLFRNMARVFILDKVTDFLLLLGKLVIVGGVGVTSFYIFSGKITGLNEELPQLNYYLVPVFLITGGAFFIADIFFGVYEMGVDTLFLCFLEDIERNDGSPERPYYMSRDLRKILGKMENIEPRSPK